ncbi:DUF2861 family protein [Vibrio intestinalis]|uniref:DUF2861 family protein n=1 Tax=Vibrio intestinalis TaxID=2933291 RepID=UPI0021A3E890|nr:DUF2861 family protein [Vibrio intestinalis]
MIKKTLILAGALCSAPAFSDGVPWFNSNSPLTQTHKHLLNDDLNAMFTSLVEVWQLEENVTLKPHLNNLLLQSLEVDCGRGLDNKSFPEWLKSVVVKRTEIESPGRDAYRAVVEIQSAKDVVDIRLTRWVERDISNDTALSKLSENDDTGIGTYIKRYNINNRLQMGLYRIDVVTKDEESWSSWLVLGEPQANMTIRWQSKDQWLVEQNSLLNSNCPLPKLTASLYDYVDGTYNNVWNESYESDYPDSLLTTDIESGRYVLAVSMVHRRWQGKIIVEQAQIISKTYDVSLEE